MWKLLATTTEDSTQNKKQRVTITALKYSPQCSGINQVRLLHRYYTTGSNISFRFQEAVVHRTSDLFFVVK